MKKLLTIMLLALVCTMSFAQSRITGKVTDTDGQPVPFASIVIKGTMTGTATEQDGTFALDKVPSAAKLIVSCIGYLDQEVEVAGRSVVNVILATDTEMLDETIVVAFGTTTKKDFTGSASTLDNKKIESRPITNVTNALEGAASGVQFTSATGQPGESGGIRIRGFGSINASSSPLYVVDGVPFDGISNLNSDDIESITILKDAASCALYGNRAANGVVLVTTKKGRSERVTFDVKINQGFSVRGIPEYDRLDAFQYVPIAWEALRNAYISGSGQDMATASANASANLISKQLMNNPFNVADDKLVSTDGVLNPDAQLLYADDLDWQKAVSRVGHRQEYSMSASGAGEKSDFFMSIGYLNEQGYTIKSYLERVNARVNVNIQPRKWLKTGLNLAGTMANSDVTNTDSSTGYVNPFYFARNIGPIYPIHQHNADGSYVLDEVTGEKVYEWDKRGAGASLGRHIVAETLWNDHLYKRNIMNSRAYVDIIFFEGLKLTINGSYDFRNYLNHTNENPHVGDGAPAGRGRIVNYRYDTFNTNQLLTYTKSINSHNMDFMLGHEAYQNNYKYVYGFKQGLIAEGNTELINYTEINSMYTYSQRYVTEGYLARANYNYAHRYYLSASFRRDAASCFHKDVRWGNFWSVGGSWRISEEPFMAAATWVDDLKLRASYGSVGNTPDSWYAWQTLYDIKKNADTPGFYQDPAAGNENLEWEKNKSFDVALDFAFLKNRISGSVEFFHRICDNLLFKVPQPLSSGYTSQWQNVGTMYNQGVELQLSVDVIRTRNFTWNSVLNASHVKNRITKLPQDEIVDDTKKLRVGHSIYDFWLYDYAGVDPETGDALFWDGGYPKNEETGEYIYDTYDPDQREKINDYTKADKYYCGTSIPVLYGSWSNSFRYRGLELSVLMTYGIGGKKYDSTYGSLMSVGSLGSSLHTDILNSWHKAGDESNIPRIDMGRSNYQNPGSSRWLTDASYLNIRNITLAYSFPKRIAEMIDLSGIRVYGSVENAHLFCARKGMDPQYNFSGTSYNDYSPARTMSVGLALQF